MTESQRSTDPRIEAAVTELRALIANRFPDTTFDVFERDDPAGVRLRAVVDIEDTDAVMDLVMDKLYEIQVEQGLPVYVLAVQPPARMAEQLRARAARPRPVSGASLFQ
jgi:hypothetical protein